MWMMKFYENANFLLSQESRTKYVIFKGYLLLTRKITHDAYRRGVQSADHTTIFCCPRDCVVDDRILELLMTGERHTSVHELL